MENKLTPTEENILKYARQWARLKILKCYISEEGFLALPCGNDAEKLAEMYLSMLLSEAELYIAEKSADKLENGKYQP